MKINIDINILGSLPDWELINYYYHNPQAVLPGKDFGLTIKTEKSIKRFKRAIQTTILSFKNEKIKNIFDSIIVNEGISRDFLLYLFWNASLNNELLRQ